MKMVITKYVIRFLKEVLLCKYEIIFMFIYMGELMFSQKKCICRYNFNEEKFRFFLVYLFALVQFWMNLFSSTPIRYWCYHTAYIRIKMYEIFFISIEGIHKLLTCISNLTFTSDLKWKERRKTRHLPAVNQYAVHTQWNGRNTG